MSVLQCIPVLLLVLALSLSEGSCKFSDNRGRSPTHPVDRSLPWGQRLINSYREQQVNDQISDNAQAKLLSELQVKTPRTTGPRTKRPQTRSMTRRMHCDLENERSRKITNEGDGCNDVPNGPQTRSCVLKRKRTDGCNDIRPVRHKAECKPKDLLCDIPAEQSTGLGKTCVKTTDGSESQTQPLNPYNYFDSISSDKLEVHTLPIGQGDCNIIYCPNSENAVLFDCGSTSSRDRPRLSPQFIREKFLSVVKHLTIMLSHGDQDHYNYLPHMFPVSDSDSWKSKIQKIIIGGNKGDYSCARARITPWLKAVRDFKIPFEEAEEKTLNLCENPNIRFDIISANKEGSKNEKSIVMKLSQDGCESSLLFTGDMEHTAAKVLATTERYKKQLQSTHYKVAHHGASSKANKDNWVAAIRPVEAHFSSAYIGSYGHPRCEAVRRIMNVGSIGFTNPIGSSSTHPFMCSGASKTPVTGDICHRFFSTTPEPDKICLIRLTFNSGGPAVTNYYCGTMTEWESDSPPDIKLCDLEEVDEDDVIVNKK